MQKMIFHCPVECQDIFESIEALNSHIQKEHKQKFFLYGWPCEFCIKKFSTSKHLINHITSVHSSTEPTTPAPTESVTHQKNNTSPVQPPKKKIKQSLEASDYYNIYQTILKKILELLR